MIKKSVSCIIIFCVLLNCFIWDVYADSPERPTPYKIEIEDENKVFYMTPKGYENENQLKSGLYYNNDFSENIYLIDYTNTSYNYFYEWNLIFSEDASYFGCIPWASSKSEVLSLTGEAVLFFKNGTLIKKYTVSQLLKNKMMGEYSTSHVKWEQEEEREFNPDTNILSITTNDNRRIEFDLFTGDIVRESKQYSEIIIFIICGVMGITLVMFLMTPAIKRKFYGILK